MSTLDFQISTRRTDILRTIRVTVYDDHAEFNAAFRRESSRRQLSTDVPENFQVDACCLPRMDHEDRDPRAYQLRIMFARPALTATVIAHEATHAALHIYSIDSYRDHARATAHLHVGNELIPYMVGDIFSAIARRLIHEGHDLNVGQSFPDAHKA